MTLTRRSTNAAGSPTLLCAYDKATAFYIFKTSPGVELLPQLQNNTGTSNPAKVIYASLPLGTTQTLHSYGSRAVTSFKKVTGEYSIHLNLIVPVCRNDAVKVYDIIFSNSNQALKE